jgi:hypothetical protein
MKRNNGNVPYSQTHGIEQSESGERHDSGSLFVHSGLVSCCGHRTSRNGEIPAYSRLRVGTAARAKSSHAGRPAGNFMNCSSSVGDGREDPFPIDSACSEEPGGLSRTVDDGRRLPFAGSRVEDQLDPWHVLGQLASRRGGGVTVAIGTGRGERSEVPAQGQWHGMVGTTQSDGAVLFT